ncbi:MAG: hypothetical protein R2710_22255 [Acidimicrobiales bacterium]
MNEALPRSPPRPAHLHGRGPARHAPARLYFLQVMEAPQFTAQAAENRTREIVTEAPRLIYDTNGKVLAGRRNPGWSPLDWTQLRDYNEEERRRDLHGRCRRGEPRGREGSRSTSSNAGIRPRNGSLKPEPIAEDVSVRLWITLQERQFPGFNVERRYVAGVYPYGSTGANIIGYIGNVGDTETADALQREERHQGLPAG